MWKLVDSNKIIGTHIKVEFPLDLRLNPIRTTCVTLKTQNRSWTCPSHGNRHSLFRRERTNTTNVQYLANLVVENKV